MLMDLNNLEQSLIADLTLDMFVGMAVNGSLLYSDLTTAERRAFDQFVELGWLSGGVRYYLTEVGINVIDEAQLQARIALKNSLLSSAQAQG